VSGRERWSASPPEFVKKDADVALRNFDEVLRLLDSVQLTAKHKVATAVNWKQGEDVIIVPSISDEEARRTFPDGLKAPKPNVRIVPQPLAR
jgi:hypothetical protein